MKAGCANSNAYLWLGGQWVFRRRISNGLTATGRAVFLACAPSVLEYCEDGELSTGGSLTKRYRFTFGDGGIVVVHADPQNDGAPFQNLLFREVPAETGYGLQADAWNICGKTTLGRYSPGILLANDWHDSPLLGGSRLPCRADDEDNKHVARHAPISPSYYGAIDANWYPPGASAEPFGTNTHSIHTKRPGENGLTVPHQ